MRAFIYMVWNDDIQYINQTGKQIGRISKLKAIVFSVMTILYDAVSRIWLELNNI